jgi:hypothetical protein
MTNIATLITHSDNEVCGLGKLPDIDLQELCSLENGKITTIMEKLITKTVNKELRERLKERSPEVDLPLQWVPEATSAEPDTLYISLPLGDEF